MYKVFISFKNKDRDGCVTEDSVIAEQIYTELQRRKISTFFSNHELEKEGVGEWRDAINQALKEANTLVLVGTSLENIYSYQVKYEWRDVFLEDHLDGRKPDCRLIPYLKNIDLRSVDAELRNWTIFDQESKSVIELCDFIERGLPKEAHAVESTASEFPLDVASSNRFNYRAGYTALAGREQEVRYLYEFCTELNDFVSWTVVCGKGGTGKSRLVYEFCRMIEKEGWQTFKPAHAKSFSINDLAGITTDTVICFDYVKFELNHVEEIIQTAIDRRIRSKLRFILIEREGSEFEDAFSYRISSYRYRKGILSLTGLSDEAIFNLIDDYRLHVKPDKEMSEEDKQIILNTLNTVDPEIRRPLFAMFITDAWADGKQDLKKWDRETAVRYVGNKELDRIYSVAASHAVAPQEKKLFLDILNLLIAYTTFIGKLSGCDLLALAGSCFPAVPEKTITDLLSDSELLKEETMFGIEPDLVGEYICIRMLNSLADQYHVKFFDSLFENHFMDMIAYFDKIYDDYENEFLAASWNSYATEMIIPRKITYISNNMFRECSFLREVKLHDRVTTIRKGGFRGCKYLRKINFPSTLEIIDSAAFMDCVSLESAMPDDEKGWAPSVISIGDRAFKNCPSLHATVIPRSVKEIGSEAYAKCKALKSLEIPWDVSVIASGTFENCSSLIEIRFRSGSASGINIQMEAFRGCSGLSYVGNSRYIQAIGKNAFENCTALKTIQLGKNLVHISDYAFRGCTGLLEIDLSAAKIESLNKSTFENCTSLEKVILPETISRVYARCFINCSALKEIRIPESLERIGELAFHGCTSLTLSSLGSQVTGIKDFCSFRVRKIDEDLVSFVIGYYDQEEVVLPDCIFRIGDRAFANDKKLQKVIFHAGIVEIGAEAFGGCSELKEVAGTFSGITAIGKSAFAWCRELRNLPQDGNISVIADSTFSNCISLAGVCFRSEIRKIGKNAFLHCNSFHYLQYAGKCDTVSTGAFSGCPNFRLTERYHIKRKSDGYYVCGFIFDRMNPAILEFIKHYSEFETVVIPSSCIGFFENPFENTEAKIIMVPYTVKTLIRNNFANTPDLVSVILPWHIRTLPEGIFEGCRNLRTVRIGRNQENTLKKGIHLGIKVFADCTSLERMEIPAGTQNIGDKAFFHCESLQSITLNDDLKSIGAEAFCGCTSLTDITVPKSVSAIGYGAFSGCKNLERIEGLDQTGITVIQKETFKECLSLTDIELPASLTSISPFAFNECRQLERISLMHTSLEYIGIAAFQNCYKLKEIIIPPQVKIIEKFTFKSCSGLETIRIPPTISEIGTSAFYGCNHLKNIDLQDKTCLIRIGNDAFAHCHRLESITLPAGITQLARGLFKDCLSLKQVIFKSGIDEISEDCFKDCMRLENISGIGHIRVVRAGAFRNCFALKDLSFLADMTFGEAACFRGCIGIRRAVFNQISTISAAMFMGCLHLEEIGFPNVEQVDNYAFFDCKELIRVPTENIRTRIGAGAFWNCYKMENPRFSDTIKDLEPSAFRSCLAVTEAIIPEGIIHIHATLFRNAINLRTVIIPSTVDKIRKSAFRDCSSLENVTIRSDDLLIERTAFSGCLNLYYFTFPGTIVAYPSAFEGTPIYQSIRKNGKVKWLDEPSQSVSPSPNGLSV